MVEEDEKLKKAKEADIAAKQRAMAAAGPSKVSQELKNRQQNLASKSASGMAREMWMFMLLIGGPIIFCVWAVLFVSDPDESKLMLGYGFKSFLLYPAYLVLKIILKVVLGGKKK